MFYNINDELLFVGKARKIRQRIKKHFEDNVSPIKITVMKYTALMHVS